jgi:hypothetical protein
MLVMMVYIVTVTYFQVDSTVYVNDDGLYCTVTYFQVDSTVYVGDDGLYCHCYLFSGYKPSSLTYTVEST